MVKWKRDKYRFWHSPLVLAIFFFILIFFGYKMIDIIRLEQETAHKKDLVLDQIDELKKRKDSLSADISKLETDEGKEEIIREKYQVVKEGEKMVTIVDKDDKDDSKQGQDKTKHGFMEWLKSIFKR